MSYRGIKIIADPNILPVNRISLSDGDYVSGKFRARMNGWLAKRFGQEDPIYMFDTSALSLFGNTGGKKVIATTLKMADIIKARMLVENIGN